MDYIHNRSRNEKVLHNNVNMLYSQATGANLPFAPLANRLFPNYGAIGYYAYTGRSDYHGLQTTVTKRFSDRWQFSGNYTLSRIKNDEPSQPLIGQQLVPFTVAPDMGGEYGIAVTDQRHRAVFNGIWEVGRGFQLSGLYFFGSGQRQETGCGGDRRDQQGASPPGRLCAAGFNVAGGIPAPVSRARSSFRATTSSRIRSTASTCGFSSAFRLAAAWRSTGMLEVFNLFDRANYQSYVLDMSSRAIRRSATRARTSHTRRARWRWGSGCSSRAKSNSQPPTPKTGQNRNWELELLVGNWESVVGT